MEYKSNSYKVKRHQREKVLRFSIRKYSFGAASVAVAALMFLGARVASADTVSGSSSKSTAGVVQPNDKGDSPVGIKDENKSEVVNNSLENKETTLVENGSNTVDKSQLRTVVEELNSLLSTKLNLDDSVLSSVKERVQRAQALLDKADAVQKDINELKELLSTDLATLSTAVKESSEVRESNTGTEAEKPVSESSSEVRASEEDQTVSAKKASLKVSVDQLQAAILEVPKHDTTKEVLEKANEVMVLAQGVLENTTVSLTDVEQMNKLVKRMFNSVKNATLRLSSGSHDPRHGQSMGQGTGFRAATVSPTWTNQNNLLIYQRFRATDGSGNIRNDNRQFTENKVDMTARIETINGQKYLVYDVFFNNDGQSMAKLSRQQQYNVILPAKILDLQSNGLYNSDTISDLHFDTYRRNNQNEGGTLSQNPDKFRYESTQNFHFLNDTSTSKGSLTFLNTLGVRQGRPYDSDMKDYFKNNKTDQFLKDAVALDGVYKKWSYGIGVRTNDKTAAVHMHFKAKLRSGVTDEDVQKAFTLAIAGTYGETTSQSYVFGSGKKDGENVEPTVKQSAKYPISGKEVTTKVDASLGNLDKPVDTGFVTRNNNFPTDIRWSWPNGKPSTTTAGVFSYKVKAQYSDNTSNTTDATLKVLPNQPVIDQNSVNEKAGKTGQTVTVNVGKGVPDNSTVTLYSGNTVIGTGITKGTTATITVSKALPSTAITAKTTVKNNGTVESEFSAPVTPTEVPDKVAPTVLINGKKLTTNADDNRFIIYRGANFNPTFRVQDDKSNHVNLSITGLPNGVANVTTSGGKEFNYTIPDNTVANEAPFGESIASVVASDGRNSETYKFKYRIVDIQAKNSTTENRALGSELGDPHNHFKVAESNTVENDKYYPTDTQFKWKEFNSSAFSFTDVANNTKLNEVGSVTKYIATATFPNTVNTKRIDNVDYTIYTPAKKAVSMTFNVADTVKPTVKLVGDNGSDTTLSESTPEASLPRVTVYRGEKANVTIKASDNTGKIKELRGSGMPNGIWFNKNPNANSEVWLSSDNATETNPLRHTITGVVEKGNRIEEKSVTINATDKSDPSNVTTVKFKMVVKEQKDKYTPTAGTTPVAVNNIGSISNSDLDKIKNSVSVPNLSPEAIRDGGVRTSLKNNGAVTTTAGKKYVTVEVTYPDGSKDEVPVEVQQNTNVVKRPIINLKQGETLSAAEMKTIVELQDGSSKQPLPADAVVTATFNTNTVRDGNWTDITVRFNDGTSKTVRANYNVKATFPVANTVYDFRGVTRTNDSESNYYVNRGLPTGMSWFVKKGTENKPDARIHTYLETDGLGKTDYTFGAYYAASRFNDNESNVNLKLKHEGTVSHHVYDVMAAPNRIIVNNGATLTEENAKAAVTKVAGSEDLPTGTTYEWVNQDGTPLANKQVTEKGEATRYVKVTLPKTAEDGPVATQYRSSKIVTVTINESEKPKVSFDGSELSTDARNENSKFVIFRGATFDPTFTVSDNSGKVTEVKASGLPSGREFVKNTDTPNGNVQITGNDITATSNAALGDHIGKVLVKDASGNEQEYQFKYTVVDIKTVENPKTVPINTKLGDSHFHVKLVNSDATDATSQESLYPLNTKFKWKKETNEVSSETQLSEPGKITGYKAVVESPAARAGFYTKNGVKIYMPASIERDITFLVKPNDIIRYSKNGDDVDKTTTTHTVDPDTGKITPTPNTVTHQKDGAKDTVVTQTIPVTTRYEPDPTKDVGTNTVVNNGSEGSIVTTTPKLVNEITGEVTNGVPVVRKTEMVPKVVKVGTKPKVVETPIEKPVRYEADPTRPKGEKTTETEGKDGKIVKTTPYIVNSDGSVTEGETTSVRTEPKEKVVKVGTQPKVETKVIPIETTYQEDPTKEVGNNEIIDNGSEGRVVTTTPYIVNDKTGEVTEGQPRVERTEMRPKVVKVGTKEAKRIPTVDVEQDPKTGDVTVTPKKPDGTPYKPGTKVEIPGKDGPITVTIGEDGKGKVPNSDLPEGKVSGPGKITEPNKPAVEVPKVETPAKVTPETPVTETPDEIEITQQPNGNAIVTPKKPDGKPYPSGSKVVIPGENNTPITVTIGNDGSGEVPNDNLPKKAVPGTGTVTEPNQKPSQPVDVTTPARKTPTVDVEQDPKTGDVTVTPKKPDGTPYKPGTKVEIPGKDGPITVTIGEDGKGKVPNSDLPEGKVSGPGKITEPNKPAVEVPKVETPAKVTPETPTDTNPVAPVTPDNNGGSGQDAPTPATPTPNADQVDTKTTMDNGAKSNDSQNVLPNTGTESNATLASLGLLGLLSGFGLVARKKKED